ncbi:hypothetical protein [Thalassolituus oleivorans]|jgi:hypothetical protein|nr:hypothetical protein [Thalassolituus oleivorans]MBQ0727555.1 hypothetical protein [Thalassolituus oleivorans]|tara:strand:- start:62 stop:424 length:363 start_codon:yes stop_codon:yes gene_type:complete
MMAKPRIVKKQHSRLLGDFLIDCSQDAAWTDKLKNLTLEGKLDTAVDGFPAEFLGFCPEAEYLKLQYCIERVELADVPRAASCWWPVDENTHYYVCYPAQFPQTTVFMAMDFDEHGACCN